MINYIINESAYSASPTISKVDKDSVEFVAVMQEADRPNRNGRIYYKKVLEEALNSPFVRERLATKSFYVEAGHPSDTSVQRQMTIDQRNIAAIVKEFWWEGNLLKARLETARTAVGRDMKGLIEQGSRVAFSLRAQGNVHRDEQLGATVVESPIQIASYDWVVNPSHDKAFLESICEATMGCLFNRGTNEMALVEAVKLFEEGSLIALTEAAPVNTIDYAQHYGKKIKTINETYFYDPKDNFRVDGKFAILENAGVQKKVILEDFILKELRHRIANLGKTKPLENSEIHAHASKMVKDGNMDVNDKDWYEKGMKDLKDKSEAQEDLNEELITSALILGGSALLAAIFHGAMVSDLKGINDDRKRKVVEELASKDKAFKVDFEKAKGLSQEKKRTREQNRELALLVKKLKSKVKNNKNLIQGITESTYKEVGNKEHDKGGGK
jgi:hypothetical protein